MTRTPSDDKPGCVAEKPEHCFACNRLMSEGVIWSRKDLAVEPKRDRLLV